MEVHSGLTPRFEHCLELNADQEAKVLAVATMVDTHPTKGWAVATLTGPWRCAEPDSDGGIDGGVADAGPTGSTPPDAAIQDAEQADARATGEDTGVTTLAQDDPEGCTTTPWPCLLVFAMPRRRRRARA